MQFLLNREPHLTSKQSPLLSLIIGIYDTSVQATPHDSNIPTAKCNNARGHARLSQHHIRVGIYVSVDDVNPRSSDGEKSRGKEDTEPFRISLQPQRYHYNVSRQYKTIPSN